MSGKPEHKPKHKIDQFLENPVYASLGSYNRTFIKDKSITFGFSFQEIKQLIDMAADLEMWQEGALSSIWNEADTEKLKGKNLRQRLIRRAVEQWKYLKNTSNDYSRFTPAKLPAPKLEFIHQTDNSIILGSCPVASEKTRCCNLLTLDAVKNCGFGCSYCSIQPFYTEGKIFLHDNLRSKLEGLCLDPDEIHHIGTGQSSDSLMWGNRNGLFDDLFYFASKNKNVILELKTKSNVIAYFRTNPVPANVIVTWSLNTDEIISAEEHHTASLHQRISAARAVADQEILVGFHLHPIVEYKGWEAGYHQVVDLILSTFRPEEVALVSLGTLTFIKPVIKLLRKRKLKSKILQMPLEDAGGKLSYPLELKQRLFSWVYDRFPQDWKQEVFFYMCMEDNSLWQDVFGRAYGSNQEFEADMKAHYMEKIRTKHPPGFPRAR
ncbi:MAG: DNA photolyase [Desulfobacterium sp.]|nr:DNA photolyase [Desulfobacterium sp.]